MESQTSLFIIIIAIIILFIYIT